MYGEMMECKSELGREIRPSIADMLKRKKEELEKDLQQTNRALDLVEKHPEITDFLDALGGSLGRILR